MLLIAVGVVALVVGLFIFFEYRVLSLPDFSAVEQATPNTKHQALSQWLDALAHQRKFNGSIVIAQNGNILFQRNIGNTNIQGQPISDTTAFNLASVSKHITAFAVLMLEHQGRLSRRNLVSQHIAELSRYQHISLDHLLKNSSGIPDYARSRTLAALLKKQGIVFTPQHLISWLAAPAQKLKFTPGQQNDYSNSNYVLLAEVISRVTGQSFADFLQSHIFAPLGMISTAVVNKCVNTDKLKDRAYGFSKQFFYLGPAVEQDLNHFDGVAGDGNIYASAHDLVIWDQALRDGTLLPKEIYQQAYQPTRLDNGLWVEEKVSGQVIVPGLSWNVQDFPRVSSYGVWQAFNNFYWRDLQHNTVVVVLSNSGYFLRTAMIGERLVKFAETLD
ncbi:hypothetical protein GCM10009092_09240 [Bowmanella denitrificans]|uniref:Beta-lactamase-related domain-containing protein n=1 Tax=Bowmanella denitrificans TaxID=366582 RepID=A0ABP3GME0_9ALTE